MQDTKGKTADRGKIEKRIVSSSRAEEKNQGCEKKYKKLLVAFLQIKVVVV